MAGLFLLLRYLKEKHFYYKGTVITFWKMKELSLGMGMFIFLSKDYLEDILQNGQEATGRKASEKPFSAKETQWPEGEELQQIKVHEYGHTIQSVLLGPLFLPVIGLPSLLWANLPVCERYRKTKGISYYSFYTERWANRLGERITGEKSVS